MMTNDLYKLKKSYIKRKDKAVIIKGYSEEEENRFYYFICKKLSERYPDFINFQSTYDIIKNKGNIFTASLNKRDKWLF